MRAHTRCSASPSARNSTGPPRASPTTRRWWCAQQDVRWCYGTLTEKVDEFAAGLLALGLEPGDRIGIWSPNNSEWAVTQFAAAKAGLILVNINPAYRLAELEYALNKVECRALVTAEAFKSSRYIEMLRRLAPELDGARPGALKAATLPHLETVVRLGTETTTGMYNFAEVPGLAGAAERDRLQALGDRAAVRRPHQHPVHQRHHGLPQGGDAQPPQHPEQRLLQRRHAGAQRARPGLHPGAALPLLRHGHGQPDVGRIWCHNGLPERGLRSAGGATRSRGGALYGALRRAHHVHRRARPSGVRALRSLLAPHRHDGGLALPDRGHAPGDRRDAHGRGDYCLRHDRDQPGELPVGDRRSDRAPGLHRRPRPPACRGQGREPGRQGGAAAARPASC